MRVAQDVGRFRRPTKSDEISGPGGSQYPAAVGNRERPNHGVGPSRQCAGSPSSADRCLCHSVAIVQPDTPLS